VPRAGARGPGAARPWDSQRIVPLCTGGSERTRTGASSLSGSRATDQWTEMAGGGAGRSAARVGHGTRDRGDCTRRRRLARIGPTSGSESRTTRVRVRVGIWGDIAIAADRGCASVGRAAAATGGRGLGLLAQCRSLALW